VYFEPILSQHGAIQQFIFHELDFLHALYPLKSLY